MKMNVLFPNFSGYTNVAVCRSDNPKMTGCYVVDAGFKKISDNLISDGTFTYLPFLPGHLYIMYRGNGKEVDKVKGFQTEVDLRKHLLDYYGTPQISGGEITDWSLVFSPTVSFKYFMIISVYIAHILDSWRLREGSGDKKRVLLRR